MTDALIVGASALVASFLSGLLGIGGGIVLVPILLYAPPLVGAVALPVKIITGLTIVQALSGSLFGLVRHRGYGNVSARALRVMGPAIAGSSLAGALVSGGTPDRWLLLVFAALAALAAVVLLLPRESQSVPLSELQVNVPLGLGIALVLGFFGGLVGIAAVALIVAALIHLIRLPVRVAIGTSLGLGVFSTLAAFLGKLATAQIEGPLGAVVFAAALAAAPAGAAVSVRTPPRTLLTLLAGVVLLAAARIAWSAVSGG